MKPCRLEVETTTLRRLRPKNKASLQEASMVFHTGRKADSKLSTNVSAGEDAGYNKTAGKKNYQLAASIFFNIIMLAMLVGAGVYLTRQRRRFCDMQIQYDSERLEELGLPYEVKHCHAEPTVPINIDLPESDGLRGEQRINEGVVELDLTNTLPEKHNLGDYNNQEYMPVSSKRMRPVVNDGHETLKHRPPPHGNGDDDHPGNISVSRRLRIRQRINDGEKSEMPDKRKKHVARKHDGLPRSHHKTKPQHQHLEISRKSPNT